MIPGRLDAFFSIDGHSMEINCFLRRGSLSSIVVCYSLNRRLNPLPMMPRHFTRSEDWSPRGCIFLWMVLIFLLCIVTFLDGGAFLGRQNWPSLGLFVRGGTSFHATLFSLCFSFPLGSTACLPIWSGFLWARKSSFAPFHCKTFLVLTICSTICVDKLLGEVHLHR